MRLASWCLAIYWPVFVYIFHVPLEPRPPGDKLPLDKVVHFGAYAVLGFLLAWVVWPWWQQRVQRSYRQLAYVLLVALMIHGAIDEVTQPLTGRNFEWLDLVADAIGGAAGIATFAWLAKVGREAK